MLSADKTEVAASAHDAADLVTKLCHIALVEYATYLFEPSANNNNTDSDDSHNEIQNRRLLLRDFANTIASYP